MFVPVVDSDQKPLMPTTSARARRWVESGKATPFFKKGVFCVRLNIPPSGTHTQPVVVGVDPGSKKEGLTVKSRAHTYLNIQADAVTWVKQAIETRRMMRGVRRSRKTPCRANRSNRSRGGLPPSTRSRWQWKLRLLQWLRRIFPVTDVIVEDVAAVSKPGKRRWNLSFSPLEVGKRWFYAQVGKIARCRTQPGYQTKAQRDALGLKKSRSKMSNTFDAHCVDSWAMAHGVVGGDDHPDNTRLLLVSPLQFRRRSLHLLQPQAGGHRRRHGGTISEGLKRGSIVRHPRHGLSYVGGTTGGRVSLHCPKTGRRLCKNAKPIDINFLSYSSWRVTFPPHC